MGTKLELGPKDALILIAGASLYYEVCMTECDDFTSVYKIYLVQVSRMVLVPTI